MENVILKIKDLEDFGRGISHFNGKVVFIPFSLKDEQVSVRLVKETSKYYLGEVKELLLKSPCRIESICPYFTECGGCQLLHQMYKDQVEYKITKLKHQLQFYLEKRASFTFAPAQKNLFYRDNVTFHVKGNKFGFLKFQTHQIIPIDKCYIVDDSINNILPSISKFLENNRFLEEITIRKGVKTNDLMLVLKGKITNKDFSCFKDSITSLVVNDDIIWGEPYFENYIFGKKFLCSGDSFFQVNTYMIEELYQPMIDFVKNYSVHTVLDLYCGTGTIGLSLASYVDKVIGIEINKSAVRLANMNASLNHFSNTKFYDGKAEEVLSKITEKCDLIVVDPPRTGLDKKTINFLLESDCSNIFYVSCNVMTLRRDLAFLSTCYDVTYIKGVDMFPNTYHVECVCLLKRR